MFVRIAIGLLGFSLLASPLQAQETTIKITIKNHRFIPAQPQAPAGRPLTLQIFNADPTPEEFESRTLRVEKVIPGKSSAIIRLRPLRPGAYNFFGEFHERTAQGKLVVK